MKICYKPYARLQAAAETASLFSVLLFSQLAQVFPVMF